jgi:very-short-patch-repair endonuclease
MYMKKCKWCLTEFETNDKPKGWMANHSRWCEKNPKVNSYKEKLKHARECFVNNKESIERMVEGIKKAHKQGAYKHIDYKSLSTGRKHTEESKRKISENRKIHLSKNKENHVWRRNTKFKSTPCEILKEYLKSKLLKFEEEFTDHGVDGRYFSIDIAFPEKKLALEVNGNQHYESKNVLKPYYKERENLLVSKGWKVIQIHYSLCFNKEELEKIYKMALQEGFEPSF